jgi:hypothetical protein
LRPIKIDKTVQVPQISGAYGVFGGSFPYLSLPKLACWGLAP